MTQCDRIDGKMNSITVCRKEIFEYMKNHVRGDPEINDLIIGRDHNQHIEENEVMQFHNVLGAHEIYSIINNAHRN